MCKHHARLIDNDYKEYSADTLRGWKISAEEAAYKSLCLPGDQYLRETSTLIQLGNDIVFHGKWLSADESKGEWTVVVKDYIYGDEYLLKEFCSKYKERNDNYIVIQDQGDGRIIKCAPLWKHNEESVICLTVNVEQKLLRTNPAAAGVDIALSSSWDLILDKSGDIATVSGMDSAKQRISTSLSTRFGEVLFDSQAGSFFYKYFCDYKERDVLLSSLLKLEVARLASLPAEGREQSPLGFVNRVIDVIFDDLNITDNDNKISLMLTIEWGDGEITSDKYRVFVGNRK